MTYMKFDQHGVYHYAMYHHPLSDTINTSEHFHPEYELLYCLQGDATISIQGKTYDLSPHTLVLIKPGEYHGVSFLSNEPYERILIQFDPCILSKTLEKLSNKLNHVYNIKDSLLKLELMRFTMRYDEIDKMLWSSFFEWQMNIIMSYLCKDENYLKIVGKSDEVLTAVLATIDEYLATIQTVGDLCKLTNLSPTYLQTLFNEHLGQSVMRYIRSKQMFWGKKMLNMGHSAQEVSEKLGFDNYSTFYRNYKKVFNTSPAPILSQNKSPK